MTYTKPEIAVLGDAVRVIEQMVKGTMGIIESFPSPRTRLRPAYELDD
jgi:hypothetical protein